MDADWEERWVRENCHSLDDCLKALDGMKRGDHPETEHQIADALLCFALRQLGRADIADAYDGAWERVGFWYS